MRLISEKEEETENMHRITQLKEPELVKQPFFLKEEQQAHANLKNNKPP